MVIAFGNGLLLPGAIAGATSVRPQAAGTAAGIIGCTQMTWGGARSVRGRLLGDATSALPMAVLMALLVVALAASFALLARRNNRLRKFIILGTIFPSGVVRRKLLAVIDG